MLITVLFTVAKRWKQPKYSSANAWIDKMRHILIHQCNAAAAKSLQSCPTLCDPIDDSPPGSPVHEIFQARTLEWVAIAFSSIERYSALKTNEFGCMCEWPWKHVRHKKINAVWFTIYVIYNSKIHRNRKEIRSCLRLGGQGGNGVCLLMSTWPFLRDDESIPKWIVVTVS